VSYLVDELRVPAILGPALSNNFIAATATTIAKDVLLMSTTASSPLIAGLDKKGLVYSVNPSDALAADAWVKYLAEIEPRLKDPDDGVTGGGPLRVMVIQRGDGLGIGMVNVINSKIRFNGMTAAQNDQAGHFKVFNYGDPFDKVNNPNPEQKYNEAAIAIANFKPHFVIGAGTSEIPEHILTKLEQDLWTEPNYRPFYIGVRGLETPALMALMQASEDDAGSKRTFRNRIITTGFGAVGSTVFANFQLRYKAEFPDPATIPPGQYAAQAYDSVYLLAFAIAAAGEEPLTGSRISAGLLKTQPAQPPAPKVDVGPDSVSNAFIDLTNSKQLDINGASGPLDIDQASGVVTTDVQLRCLNVDGSGKPIGWKDSGRYLSTATGELTGTLNCPQ
jgi:ABC-type branched-subunit amino acid transport system substrate-binding protein